MVEKVNEIRVFMISSSQKCLKGHLGSQSFGWPSNPLYMSSGGSARCGSSLAASKTNDYDIVCLISGSFLEGDWPDPALRDS